MMFVANFPAVTKKSLLIDYALCSKSSAEYFLLAYIKCPGLKHPKSQDKGHD